MALGARFFSCLQSWAELAGHALSWLPGDVMAALCALTMHWSTANASVQNCGEEGQ